jgi:hypothetical protein
MLAIETKGDNAATTLNTGRQFGFMRGNCTAPQSIIFTKSSPTAPPRKQNLNKLNTFFAPCAHAAELCAPIPSSFTTCIPSKS